MPGGPYGRCRRGRVGTGAVGGTPAEQLAGLLARAATARRRLGELADVRAALMHHCGSQSLPARQGPAAADQPQDLPAQLPAAGRRRARACGSWSTTPAPDAPLAAHRLHRARGAGPCRVGGRHWPSAARAARAEPPFDPRGGAPSRSRPRTRWTPLLVAGTAGRRSPPRLHRGRLGGARQAAAAQGGERGGAGRRGPIRLRAAIAHDISIVTRRSTRWPAARCRGRCTSTRSCCWTAAS